MLKLLTGKADWFMQPLPRKGGSCFEEYFIEIKARRWIECQN
jgi:hypothetical protein